MTTWLPVLAFAAIALSFTIGDYISLKTKGLIASILTVDILFLVFGGILKILPADMAQVTFLAQITSAFGMALIMTNLGSTFKLSEFVREWKTVLVALAGTAGCSLVCLTLGSMLFGREMAFACAAPLAGGIVAGTISTEIVMAQGRNDLAIFISGVIGFQVLLGAPVCSFCLRKEATRFISAGEHNIAVAAVASTGEKTKKKLLNLPTFFDSPNAHMGRLALLAGLGMLISSATGIPGAVLFLLFGVLGVMTGFLDKDSLTKAGAKGFLTLAMFAMICQSWLTISMEQFLSILIPMFVYMLIGIVGALILSIIVGKCVGWSIWMSMAVSMCIILGYPTNYVVTTEIVGMAVKDKNFTEAQVERITNHLLSKILIGSIAAISIASAVLASTLAPMIFK